MTDLLEVPHVFVTRNHADLAYKGEPVSLDRTWLRAIGYGEAALDTLEAGVSIVYVEKDTPPDCTIIELPDGSRYLERDTWLEDQKAWRVERLCELSKAPR